jgi:hypothetical protein
MRKGVQEMTPTQIMTDAALIYDALSALQRMTITGDWSELKELTDLQILWLERVAIKNIRTPFAWEWKNEALLRGLEINV